LSAIFDPELATHGDTRTASSGCSLRARCATGDRWNSQAWRGVHATFKGFIRDTTYGALNPDDPQMINPLIRRRPSR
jgi:hypothetical protein